jgi:hypothetical protein
MANGIMAIQKIAMEILKMNGIDPAAGEFYLKLQKPNYDDLVIERCGDDIFVGHYFNQNGDRVPDPVFVMDYSEGYWYPVRIEQVLGETQVSYKENGKRKIYPARVKEFKSFQAMFARNIKAQGWLNVEPAKKEDKET